MNKQVLVIGLGQFGMAVAQALSARRAEVLAVDEDDERVRAASGFVTESACFDATDESALARVFPERRDVCLCAIGDEAKESSIICTALLRQMGAKRVIARANDSLHSRILTLVGAHHVVNPEREFGDRFANQLLHEGILEQMSLGEGLLITEISTPKLFFDRTLLDLQLPKRFGVTVVAIRKRGTGKVMMPNPDLVFEEGDTVVVVAKEQAVARLVEGR